MNGSDASNAGSVGDSYCKDPEGEDTTAREEGVAGISEDISSVSET